jgi:hypothetical protein
MNGENYKTSKTTEWQLTKHQKLQNGKKQNGETSGTANKTISNSAVAYTFPKYLSTTKQQKYTG